MSGGVILANHPIKLSFFLGFLDVNPFQDVILHHPNWTVHTGERTLREFEDRANEALDNPGVYVEAIPKRVSFLRASYNFYLLSLTLSDTLWYNDMTTWWEEIGWSYHERTK